MSLRATQRLSLRLFMGCCGCDWSASQRGDRSSLPCILNQRNLMESVTRNQLKSAEISGSLRLPICDKGAPACTFRTQKCERIHTDLQTRPPWPSTSPYFLAGAFREIRQLSYVHIFSHICSYIFSFIVQICSRYTNTHYV